MSEISHAIRPQPPLLVVTDLDGTLLDHHSYSFRPALPALQRLRTRAVPLILASSKTFEEMVIYNRSLDNRHPLIAENGGLLAVPEGYFSDLSEGRVEQGYRLLMMAADIDRIRAQLRTLRTQGYAFHAFADMDIDEICAHTGLDRESARLAALRRASEPLLWQDGEARKQAFIDALRQTGLRCVQGGRFLHVLGLTDKAVALAWLRERYGAPRVIALGDSQNDRDLLSAADYPVVVRRPDGSHLSVPGDQTLYTDDAGPAGWNQAVQGLLDTLVE